MAGGGTVTPIVPGPSGPSTFQIAEALPYTLLSLPRYAQIIGVNPAHFQGALGEEVFPLGSNACNDLWPRHTWQQPDRISHEDLAYAIQDAEIEIAQVLGYFPAPYWIAQEVHYWQRIYRQDMQRISGKDITQRRVGYQTKFGKVISPGQRAVTLIGTATVAGASLVYSDADSDGFVDRATVTMTTTETNICSLKVYFAGESGNQEWEIRPERSKSISGGVATFIFPAWLFIDPDIQSAYPTTEGFRGINLSTTANYVTSVDVYKEYTDTTGQSAEFYWEPSAQIEWCTVCSGTGCAACTLTSQAGCIHIRDAESGLVVPTPATYADGAWTGSAFAVGRDPDEMKIWYYAGALDNLNLRGSTCKVMPPRMERAIAYLATARLERPMCSCSSVTGLYHKLQRDLAFADASGSYQINDDDVGNTFGTKAGEIYAWRYIQNTAEHVLKGNAV